MEIKQAHSWLDDLVREKTRLSNCKEALNHQARPSKFVLSQTAKQARLLKVQVRACEAHLEVTVKKSFPQREFDEFLSCVRCERFHKIILHEFYRIIFRKKLYSTLEELQKDPSTGWNTAIMSELIRARCAAAERQWQLYLMVNLSGPRKFSLDLN